MNCVCQNAAQGPGVQEVLDSVERQTVCTDTGCFEDEASAFGLTGGASAGPSNQNMFYMFMTCASGPAAPYARTDGRRALTGPCAPSDRAGVCSQPPEFSLAGRG